MSDALRNESELLLYQTEDGRIFERGIVPEAVIRKFRIVRSDLQALERRPMTIRDWIAKLDEFLKVSGRELLDSDSAGSVSHEQALQKAEREKLRRRELAGPSRVERDFERAIKQLPVRKLGKMGGEG